MSYTELPTRNLIMKEGNDAIVFILTLPVIYF